MRVPLGAAVGPCSHRNLAMPVRLHVDGVVRAAGIAAAAEAIGRGRRDSLWQFAVRPVALLHDRSFRGGGVVS